MKHVLACVRRYLTGVLIWLPIMVIDVRDTIGCYLQHFNIRNRKDFECMPIYELLPLLEREYLPLLYLR